MQKSKINTILLALIVVLLIVVLWMLGNKKVEKNNLEISNQISSNTANTYIYTNHGFSIELPKGFTPEDFQLESEPTEGTVVAYVVSLPKGYVTYTADASWWETNNISQYKYIKDKKIGDTIFKIYSGHNDNPSGLSENDKFILIPIIININQ